MAAAMYPKAKQAFLSADIDMEADTIQAVIVDGADYTYSSSHEFLTDVPSGARVATATLASKTVTNGVFDAADTAFPAVTGDPSEIVIIFKQTGSDATSRLIVYLDGVSVTPNGGQINAVWDNGANKIFTL